MTETAWSIVRRWDRLSRCVTAMPRITYAIAMTMMANRPQERIWNRKKTANTCPKPETTKNRMLVMNSQGQ